MSETERLNSDRLWFWLDFETTSLDIESLTVIEAGWTVTRPDLTQVCPVRSRYCAFSAGSTIVTPQFNVPTWKRLDRVVLEMHEKSGLTGDYDDTPSFFIVQSMAVLDQLIFDDLINSGWDGETKIVLAGAGLAGFDRHILQANKSRILDVAHYRSADTSITCEVLGVPVPKTSDQLSHLVDSYLPLDSKSIQFEGCVRTPQDEIFKMFHRARVDVAVSLLTARALRLMITAQDKRSNA